MQNRNDFDTRLVRLLEATSTKNDAALAKVLGIQPQAINGARKRKIVPGIWIEKIAEEFNVTADWLLFGRGPMRPDDKQNDPIQIPTREPLNTLPPVPQLQVVGLAACGLAGWYNPSPLAITVPYPYGPPEGIFPVIAIGESMIPDGIKQGFLLFCDRKLTPLEEDVVFVEKKDGDGVRQTIPETG